MGIYIFLVVLAVICIAGSFFITEIMDGRLNTGEQNVTDEMLAELLNHNKDMIESSIVSSIGNVKIQTIEETTQELNRLTNEKIMAVDEFSDTVLEKISQNHAEVIFLYNMLNEKEKEMKQAMASGKVAAGVQSQESGKSGGKAVKTGKKKVPHLNKQDNERSANHDLAEMSEDDKKREAGNRTEILEAYNRGESITEIAKRLNIGKGEVKLIIDLYQGAKQ